MSELKDIASLIVRDCCEQDRDEDDDAIHILPEQLDLIIKNRLEAYARTSSRGEVEALVDKWYERANVFFNSPGITNEKVSAAITACADELTAAIGRGES